MTKYVSGERIKMLLIRMGMTEYSGRHHLAPQLQGDSDNAASLMESNDGYHLCLRECVGNESP